MTRLNPVNPERGARLAARSGRVATGRRRVLAPLLAAVAMLGACSGDGDRPERRAQPPPSEDVPRVEDAPAVGDPGPVHVHGLGLNPTDGALFMATHTGLFRQPRRGAKPTRVANRFQDTMAFTVVGADRFLASGHPDSREDLPPFLGLIESRDAGRSWTPVSLQGEMDFHVLEAAGRRIYGFGSDWETRTEQLLVSDDAGRSWRERGAPEPLIDLAIDPDDADRAVAAGRAGLHLTVDAGRRWRQVRDRAGLLAWTDGGLYSVDSEGVVRLAPRDLSRAKTVGRVGNSPAAFDAVNARNLYVALHDGTIKRSSDGGRSWQVGFQAPLSKRGRDNGGEDHSGRARESRPSPPRSEAFRERCEALPDLQCGPGMARRKK
jgi:hypothetical protein